MISSHTIKFTPALSQKELTEKLHSGEHLTPEELSKLHQMKATITLVGDFEDLKKVSDFIKQLLV